MPFGCWNLTQGSPNPDTGRPPAFFLGCARCSMTRAGCLLSWRKPIPCRELRRPPLLPILTSQGFGACIRLTLPLTVVPASSTLIYGAIWCQVIAHQYPIYHTACHRLWLLLHKAKALERKPVTQSTGRGHRRGHVATVLFSQFASYCQIFP